jgi:hypothetical protein
MVQVGVCAVGIAVSNIGLGLVTFASFEDCVEDVLHVTGSGMKEKTFRKSLN